MYHERFAGILETTSKQLRCKGKRLLYQKNIVATVAVAPQLLKELQARMGVRCGQKFISIRTGVTYHCVFHIQPVGQ